MGAGVSMYIDSNYQLRNDINIEIDFVEILNILF